MVLTCNNKQTTRFVSKLKLFRDETLSVSNNSHSSANFNEILPAFSWLLLYSSRRFALWKFKTKISTSHRGAEMFPG